jgi:hypothetical protein
MKRLLLPVALLLVSAAARAGSCVPDSHTLCLSGSRFAVETAYKIGPGLSPLILSTAVPLTDESGYFWFFDSSNVEILIKVLDGCAINGHSWVFAGGLTNVEVSITVTDTETGAVRSYGSAFGTPFPPIEDTAAFECP